MYETQAELDAFFKCLFQFRPVKKLGEGAFGMAVLVYDDVEKAHKVFKLPKDQPTTEALLHEGANLRKLSELLHPNIIRLHQYGKVVMEWNGQQVERYYLNMAFGGTSLRAKLGKLRCEPDEDGNPRYVGGGQRLPVEQTLGIAVDACQGLEAAHGFRGAAVRMLHRDVSPDNLLIDDETGVARLMDFGIARVVERSTAFVTLAGKLLYMDPECFKGRGGVQSDLYSLGIVIYEMATGQLPFANFEDRLHAPPKPPHELVPDLPPELSAIVLRLLENNVEARYPSATDVLADLRRLRVRINPLPPRYRKLSDLPDGRLLCDDTEAGERVAVRLVATTASVEELARQCGVVEALDLPGVDLPLRHFRNEEVVGVVSRVPDGPTLAERFPPPTVQKIDGLRELCETLASTADLLAQAHEAGIVHGLLAPGAVSVNALGPGLCEFGLAPVLGARPAGAPQAGLGPGVRFLSPQLLTGGNSPTPADDVYALGAVLFERLTGRPPLTDAERARVVAGDMVAESVQDLQAANRLVPPKLAAAVAKALHWAPQERFAAASDLASALRAVRWPEDVVESLAEQALEAYPPGGSNAELIRACDLIDLAVRLDPGNARAHFVRGVVYYRNQSYEFAIQELRKASRVAPGREVLDLLGQAYVRHKQQYAEAVEASRAALAFGEDATVLDHLARALKGLGKRDEALAVLWQSIGLERDESLRQRRLVLAQQWAAAPAPRQAAAASPPDDESQTLVQRSPPSD